MDTVKSANSSNLGGKIRSFSKVLRFRTAGVVPDDNIRKTKLQQQQQQQKIEVDLSSLFKHDEEHENRMAVEALLAKVFASLSSVKAAYAQFQISQSPYDAEGIQRADDVLVGELKRLSELKQCYLKKQIDPCPEETQLLAEREEQKNLLRTYEIIVKKIESQLKLKDSEVSFLKEKADECSRENRSLEKSLNRGGAMAVFDELYLSRLNPTHFDTLLKNGVKSIRSFVKLMINGMESSGWDIDAAACSIDPNVIYTKTKHKCFGFESFVCREMFDGFHYPNFSLQKESTGEIRSRGSQLHFFEQFMKMKSMKPKALLARNPLSTMFGKFCRAKYLRLVHPKMEISLFGDLNQRNIINAGGYPETSFFNAFSEMARRVWLLHCLAFSFEPEASIFQIRKGCRFSEVYMESVTQDAFMSAGNLQVSLTVVPGFKIGKTVIQAQVYLSPTS